MKITDEPGMLRVRLRDDQRTSGSGNNYATALVVAEHAERAAFARQALAVKLRELNDVCAERDRLNDLANRISKECRDLAAHCEQHDYDLNAAIRGDLRWSSRITSRLARTWPSTGRRTATGPARRTSGAWTPGRQPRWPTREIRERSWKSSTGKLARPTEWAAKRRI